uniref:Putative capsid protein n=1 Tax=viral metagenome TaxID=1070528 RepID=A0A6M3LQM0_9ZZZZ
MAVMSTQNLQYSWARDLDELLMDEYTRQPEEFTSAFKMGNSNDHFVKKALMATLGAATEITQGGATPHSAFVEGPSKTVYFTKYGMGLQATEEAWDDQRQPVLRDVTAELGKSLAYCRDLKAWDVYNSGFVTTARTGIDGKALFASDHPLYGATGVTASNLVTGTLSKTTLKTALDKSENLVNEQNIPIVSRGPYVVLVAPANRWIAEEIIKSEYDPETANNAVNPINTLYGKSLTYKVIHYFTSTTQWFVYDMGMKQYGPEFIWRQKMRRKFEQDYNTDNRLWKATMRFIATFWYWRNVVGSSGT